MIKGKKIDMVAVAMGTEVLMCTAPYLAPLYPGDQVVVEDKQDFGTVLIHESVTIGGEDFNAIDALVITRKVLSKVDYSSMNWDGYKEMEDE